MQKKMIQPEKSRKKKRSGTYPYAAAFFIQEIKACIMPDYSTYRGYSS